MQPVIYGRWMLIAWERLKLWTSSFFDMPEPPTDSLDTTPEKIFDKARGQGHVTPSIFRVMC